ncbi:VCBS repeat-containing protein [Streptomyces sp. Li-HN-5-11]|uniref:FG-GAP repeat domain-containing protein n=1 Tax=Streptomyces sp. Li-HN-5-11 TaxID=3075432 RepID=UPI0028B02887|nr:VCBS repeat-containing protein [Streptomyces sp. Li-HN-5-11]WNM29546.1 VCBS repeat-containing protein [Streptomyces sp. Li-HN-5-11]
MLPPRTTGRRLGAALTVLLALTAGGVGLAAPATGAPTTATAPAGTQDQSVSPFPKGDVITGVTASGYVTWNQSSGTRSWLPAGGGSTRQWTSSTTVAGTGSGDLVATNLATSSGSTARITDMATGSVVNSYDIGPFSSGIAYAGAAGTSLFTRSTDSEGGITLWMHSKGASPRMVTDLPQNVATVTVVAGTATYAQVIWSTGGAGEPTTRFLGLLDLSTGAITETYTLPTAALTGDITVSATHVAWVEYTNDNGSFKAAVDVTDRSTGRSQKIQVGAVWPEAVEIGLQGDWLTYGNRGGLDSISTYSSNALTAYNLQTGATRKLLDHLTSAATAPDGTLFARGGTVAQDEGVYRIAPDQGGAPAATLVASTGEPTRVTLTGYSIPAVVDLDQNGGTASLVWNLSRGNVEMTVTLRHVRTGKTRTVSFTNPGTPVRFDWEGGLGSMPTGSAYNGDYTWTLVAKPLNAIGPDLTASGTFRVTRTPKPHDVDDNGSPNVLARDTAGRLWNSDTYYDPYNAGQLSEHETKLVGGGWNTYNQIETVGNVGGATHADLVARDGSGVLWLYLGRGDGTFATRVRVGGGWQIYNKITGGTDYTGDGKADLLATDTSGVLWLYKGTGNYAAPFAGRVRVGGGWGVYNKITAVGNVGGAAAGDLVARDGSGVLWLYLGYGNGTFAPRIRIGAGWNVYSDLVGIGDANRDGRPDLFAYDKSHNKTYYYRGTGNSREPFAARTPSASPDQAGNPYPYNRMA